MHNWAKRLGLWGGVVLIIVGVFYGLIRLGGGAAPTGGEVADASVLTPTATDWSKGQSSAPVTLVEYSDFQCPACASFYPLVKQLVKEFPNELRVIYRHFPLDQHANALPAALAAEASGKQNKFWEMHDLLFERQRSWEGLRNPTDTFVSYAKELGLNEEQFKKDFEDSSTTQKINQQVTASIPLRINSTPSFFLNGKKIPNPRGYEDFRATIQNAFPRP